MAKDVLTDLDFNSVSKIVNLPTPTSAGDAVNKAYVDSAVEGLAWKDNVRVRTSSNTNLSSPGATLDGVTMVEGDRVLVSGQTNLEENGIYVWNGAALPMSRTSDASTFEELEQAVVTVTEGTSAGTSFRQEEVGGVLDTDSIVWGLFGATVPPANEATQGIAEEASQAEVDAETLGGPYFVSPEKLGAWDGKVGRYAVDIGDGTETQYTVTHNLNSRDVAVTIYRVASPYDEVLADVEHTTVNSLTVRFASAPTTNQFRVVVKR